MDAWDDATGVMDEIPAGFQIFAASPSDWLATCAAKAYIERQQLTSQDVRLYRTDECVIIETKRAIILPF